MQFLIHNFSLCIDFFPSVDSPFRNCLEILLSSSWPQTSPLQLVLKYQRLCTGRQTALKDINITHVYFVFVYHTHRDSDIGVYIYIYRMSQKSCCDWNKDTLVKYQPEEICMKSFSIIRPIKLAYNILSHTQTLFHLVKNTKFTYCNFWDTMWVCVCR